MSWWIWLLISLAVLAALYAAFVIWLRVLRSLGPLSAGGEALPPHARRA